MKMLLKEEQFKRILESTFGIDDFTNRVLQKFFTDDCDGSYIEFKKLFVESIEKSGCQKIEFKPFKIKAAGLSLHDRVIINDSILNETMGTLLYVIFHEIAHQYQFKKYGIDALYDLYANKMPIEDGVKFLRKIETIADEYGMRKARDFARSGFINIKQIPKFKAYTTVTDELLKQIIEELTKYANHETSKEKISEALFNNIINAE